MLKTLAGKHREFIGSIRKLRYLDFGRLMAPRPLIHPTNANRGLRAGLNRHAVRYIDSVGRYIYKLATLGLNNSMSNYVKVPWKFQYGIAKNVLVSWYTVHPACNVRVAVFDAWHPFGGLTDRKRDTR
jgi:hypothetical protein